MTALLTEIGGRYLDRWATVLVLPGLLYVAGAIAARRVGQSQWHDLGRLAGLVDEQAPPGLLLVVLILVLAAAAGLAARAVAALLGRLWFGPWPAVLRFPARKLTAFRAARWNRAQQAFAAVADQPSESNPKPANGNGPERRAMIDAAAQRRNAIALTPPDRPTWMADRLNAVDVRILSWYGLDLVFTWPRLWLILDEAEQGTLRAARATLDAAVALAAWGVLTATLACWWWPAVLLGAALFTIGVRNARTAVDTLAHLTEAAFDLHATDLATRLGFPTTDLTEATGHQVTRHLRKHA
jgi:hypothetical protein